ncbi:MAG: hypothetical protein C4523_08140 [Myxococcales bacterium]|nr:MAG: hypothetical protein C4523_08140 [Myxococcales bacterium]
MRPATTALLLALGVWLTWSLPAQAAASPFAASHTQLLDDRLSLEDDGDHVLLAGSGEGETNSDSDDYRRATEWFGLALGLGNYGLDLEAKLFTVRWKYVYWNILRAGGVVVGWSPAVYGGSGIGYPLFLDAAGRHELRFGLGAHFGGMISDLPSSWDSMNVLNFLDSDIFLGVILSPEAFYVYRFMEHVAVQVGLQLYVAAIPIQANAFPDPMFVGSAGMAF